MTQRRLFSRYRNALAGLLLAAVFGCAAARAQSPESTTGGTGGLAAGGSFSAVHFQYGQHWVYGATGFADANLTFHYGIEGEGNWSRWHTQSDTWSTTYLIGPRYNLPTLFNYRFRPYAKFLIGSAHFNLPYNGGYDNYFVMAPGAGIDYHYRGRFDIRVCDLEYQYGPNFIFGSNTNLSVSAGIRYRIF